MRAKILGITLVCAAFMFTNVHAGNAARSAPRVAAEPVPAEELRFDAIASEPEGLSSQQVTDLKSGAVFKVYFDEASAKVAKRSAPVLAAFYREIAALVAAKPDAVKWHAVLFARNADNLILTRKEGETLWRVDVGADGELDQAGIKRLYATIPHEQTHATQGNELGMLRWFTEGQASWAESQVTRQWNPELARMKREELAAAVKTSNQPLALGRWGGMSVKPEAIARQLTPEQRERQRKDPTWSPPGPFSFNDDDLVSDESNTEARYGGSLALFERIDRQAGREALLAWFEAVRGADSKLNNSKLAALALQYTRMDIAADLK